MLRGVPGGWVCLTQKCREVGRSAAKIGLFGASLERTSLTSVCGDVGVPWGTASRTVNPKCPYGMSGHRGSIPPMAPPYRTADTARFPALVFVRSLRQSRDRFAATIALLMCGYGLLMLSIAVLPGTSAWWMRRFHLRSDSFVLWAITQPAPWMYNFENHVLVSERPLSAPELDRPPTPLAWVAVNHQSAHEITFTTRRAKHLRDPGDKYFYLKSRYRDVRVRSAYRVVVLDEVSPMARPAEVISLELP